MVQLAAGIVLMLFFGMVTVHSLREGFSWSAVLTVLIAGYLTLLGCVSAILAFFPEFEKKPDYLFSIDTKLENYLNKHMVPNELKDIFKANKFPLSDNVSITKREENEWVIAHEEKFVIRKEDEKLKVYLGVINT